MSIPFFIILCLLFSFLYHKIVLDALSIFFKLRYSSAIGAALLAVLTFSVGFYDWMVRPSDFFFLLLQVMATTVVVFAFLKVSSLQALFTGAIVVFYIYTLQSVFLTLGALLFNQSIELLKVNPFLYPLVIVIAKEMIYFIFFAVHRYIFLPLKGMNLSFGKTFVFQVMVMQVLVIGIMVVMQSLMVDPSHYVVRMLLLLGLSFTNFVALRIFFQYAVYAALQKENEQYNSLLKSQIIKQKKYYDSLRTEVDTLKKFNHDYEKLKSVLGHLLNARSIEENKPLIEEFLGEISNISSPTEFYSNNVILDSICHHAQEVCAAHGIGFEAQVYFDKRLTVSEFDLIRIANNLLQNAIEANLKVHDESRRYIRVETQYKENWLIYTIENAYSGSAFSGDDWFVTTKKNPLWHGQGLKIVTHLVEKYGATLNVNANSDAHVFTVKIAKYTGQRSN